jgi:hypothetical protein
MKNIIVHFGPAHTSRPIAARMLDISLTRPPCSPIPCSHLASPPARLHRARAGARRLPPHTAHTLYGSPSPPSLHFLPCFGKETPSVTAPLCLHLFTWGREPKSTPTHSSPPPVVEAPSLVEIRDGLRYHRPLMVSPPHEPFFLKPTGASLLLLILCAAGTAVRRWRPPQSSPHRWTPSCRPASAPHRYPRVTVSLRRHDVAWHIPLASLVHTRKTQCWSGCHSVVAPPKCRRATPTVQRAVTMGRPQLIWPLGRAGATRPWADFGRCTVQHFPISEILFPIKISRNSFMFQKFIENKIKLKKYKVNFFRILLIRSLQ